jgi:hypothetical protein
MGERYIKTVESLGLGREINPLSLDYRAEPPLRHYGLHSSPPSVQASALLFEAPPDEERPTTDQETDLVERLHDIHNYSHQLLKSASDGMQTRYDKLANSAGYHGGGWCGSVVQPARKGNRPSFNLYGKAHTK